MRNACEIHAKGMKTEGRSKALPPQTSIRTTSWFKSLDVSRCTWPQAWIYASERRSSRVSCTFPGVSRRLRLRAAARVHLTHPPDRLLERRKLAKALEARDRLRFPRRFAAVRSSRRPKCLEYPRIPINSLAFWACDCSASCFGSKKRLTGGCGGASTAGASLVAGAAGGATSASRPSGGATSACHRATSARAVATARATAQRRAMGL